MGTLSLGSPLGSSLLVSSLMGSLSLGPPLGGSLLVSSLRMVDSQPPLALGPLSLQHCFWRDA